MSEKEIFEYIFTWHCLSDACEKCRALNGREWREQDLFQNTLWDMFYADIWDLNNNISLAHPNCRCQLEVRVIQVNFQQIPEYSDFTHFLNILGGLF